MRIFQIIDSLISQQHYIKDVIFTKMFNNLFYMIYMKIFLIIR